MRVRNDAGPGAGQRNRSVAFVTLTVIICAMLTLRLADAHEYRHGYRRHHHGNHLSFSFHAPAYRYYRPGYYRPRTVVVAPAPRVYYRSEPVLVVPAPVVAYQRVPATVIQTQPVQAAPAVPRLFYYPRQNQSEKLQNIDRLQCESWALGQTGGIAPASSTRTVRTVRYEAASGYRDSPLVPAAGGAALGAVGGAIAGDAALGAAAGAAVGAASWFLGAVAGPPPQTVVEEVVVESTPPIAGASPDDLRRALTACMEGRGYTVR